MLKRLSRVIYPESYAQFAKSGRTTEELMGILTAVNLEYLPSREGGWHTRKEWRDVLSGGEKQRVWSPCFPNVLRLLSVFVGSDGHGSGILPSSEDCGVGRYVLHRRSRTEHRLTKLHRMHERGLERRRRPDVRARKIARHHAHYNFSSVSLSDDFRACPSAHTS